MFKHKIDNSESAETRFFSRYNADVLRLITTHCITTKEATLNFCLTDEEERIC